MPLKLIFILVFLAACEVGTFGPDGSSGGDDTKCVDRAATIAPAHTHAAPVGGVADNSKAPGGCIQVACHLVGQLGTGANAKDFGGTLYKPDGTTPQAGATIRIKNMAGTLASATTDMGGNFYLPAGALSSPFPANTQATVCPQITPMQGTLQQGNGNCNTGGACHGVGGTVVMTLSDTL